MEIELIASLVTPLEKTETRNWRILFMTFELSLTENS